MTRRGILGMYRDGLALDVIAERVDLGPTGVKRVIDRYGATRPSAKGSKAPGAKHFPVCDELMAVAELRRHQADVHGVRFMRVSPAPAEPRPRKRRKRSAAA